VRGHTAAYATVAGSCLSGRSWALGVPPRRLPTPVQWLDWAARRQRLEPERFRQRCDLFALVGALDAASAARPSNDPGRDLARRLAAVTGRLVLRPPYEPRRRALAIATAELICELNGYELRLGRAERRDLEREAHRPVGAAEALERWIAKRLLELAPDKGLATRIRATRTLGRSGGAVPRLFIARPHTLVGVSDRDRLDDVVHQMRAVAREVARSAGSAWPTEDLCFDEDGEPLQARIHIDAPACDERWNGDPIRHCPANRRLLWRANALVVLGHEGGSHSTGQEHSEVALDTAVQYIGWGNDPFPSSVAGNLPLRNLQTDRVHWDGDVVAVFEAFLWRNWESMERSARMADLRGLTFGPLADRFRRAFGSMTPGGARGLLRTCGLIPDARQALESHDGLATMQVEAIQRVASAVGFHAPSFLDSPAQVRLTDHQLDALAEYQHEYELLPGESSALRREAERQQLLGVLRFSLTARRDWLEFHRHVREGRGM
jgi:hypothetical protein